MPLAALASDPRAGAVSRLRADVPRWWRGEVEGALWSAADVALAPAELSYRAAVSVRNMLYDKGLLRSVRAGATVVSVGNIAVGGTGKTPVTRWCAEQLEARGARVAVLHGG